MTWWWESIHGANLYHPWSALARFLDGTAIASPHLQPASATVKDALARVWAVATPREALIWLLNPAANWPEGANLESPPSVSGAVGTVPAMDDGPYSVEWSDTLEGKVVATAEARATTGQLTLTAPDFRVDLAARVKKR